MNEKNKKFTNRIDNLINEYESEIIPKRRRRVDYYNDYYYEYDKQDFDLIQKWLINSENVLVLIFGDKSFQREEFTSIIHNDKTKLADRLHKIKGLLEGVKDDLENGFLIGQEFIIANEVFDSVLDEADFFINKQKNKDIGAILLRIILEDAIKRISNKEGLIVENKKASLLNDELKSKGVFIQTVWRQNQAWLDIGNNASHGKFNEYTLDQVKDFHHGLTNFLTTYFN